MWLMTLGSLSSTLDHVKYSNTCANVCAAQIWQITGCKLIKKKGKQMQSVSYVGVAKCQLCRSCLMLPLYC